MALRNQPYLPLYVQDFLTDEKLIECSAQSTGVYIRIMCVMHKSEQYGTILLKQNDKQTDNQINNFALKLAKHFPYPVAVIESALIELLTEKVLQIDGDLLVQKRMVKDNNISEIRASVGSKGGKKTQTQNNSFANNFAKANIEANTEYESESENKDLKWYEKYSRQLFDNSDDSNFRLERLNMLLAQNRRGELTKESVKDFNSNLVVSGKIHRTFNEYMEHLKNWSLARPNNTNDKPETISSPYKKQ